jgi:hypothetical protein
MNFGAPRRDQRDCRVEITKDALSIKADDAVPQAAELAIIVRIRRLRGAW